jgi:hypothetical protein
MNDNVNNQDAGVNRQTQSANQSALSTSQNLQSIVQSNPPATSDGHSFYKDKPSFTYALDSYERAARREYIKLMRNLVDTQQYPMYHVIVNFYSPMPIKVFAEKRNKAHGYLKRWKVRAYYVHEPTVSRDWLHIHMMVIYGGGQDDLRECVKIAWELVGLKYRQDFRVKVRPVGATVKDYSRLCAYILKFNGKRKTNRYTPDMFVKDLGLRKTGTIGKWFAKPKGKIWKEYREELRLKHEQQSGKDIADIHEPAQSVTSENLSLRPATGSQRAMVAHDVWESAKANGGVPKMTREQVAKRFNVGRTMMLHAGTVKKSASETLQQAVRAGTMRLGKVVDVIKMAEVETGIAVTKDTVEADKQKAFEAQERMFSGESDEQKFNRKIAEIQKLIAQIERVSELIDECDEMLRPAWTRIVERILRESPQRLSPRDYTILAGWRDENLR